MLKVKDSLNYLHKIDDYSKYPKASGLRMRREHLNNTIDFYFETIGKKDTFSQDTFSDLNYWLYEVAEHLHNQIHINEAITIKGTIILKETYKLLHFISRYHSAYILRKQHPNKLKNTIFGINEDTQAVRKKINHFLEQSKSFKHDRLKRKQYLLTARVLGFMISSNAVRAKFYITSYAMFNSMIKWDEIFTDDMKDIQEAFMETAIFFMYPRFTPQRIVNSLMIVVYTFLKDRLNFSSKDSLDLTNRLYSILHPYSKDKNYKTAQLSKDIYLYDTFDYLPIYAHKDKRYNPPMSDDEQKRLGKSVKNILNYTNDSFKQQKDEIFDNYLTAFYKTYITSYEPLILYTPKDE